MKIGLCLLTRNELPCLKELLHKIPSPSPESGFDFIVAIDGHSTDGTVPYLEQHGVSVIAQSGRGRGEAIIQAINKVDADALIFFSPDGNESIEDIIKFRPLLETGHDIVIASRMMRGAVNEEDANLLKMRKWANNSFNLLANLFFRKSGPFITDSINGFRAVRLSTIRSLGLNALDYSIEYQMTIRALKQGLKIVEFPTVEGQRIAGESGAPSLSTGIRFIKRLVSEVNS